MALTLHTNWLKGSYKEDRDYIIRMGENDQLYKGIKHSGESSTKGVSFEYLLEEKPCPVAHALN